jgi:hypothetical protein
MVRALIHALGPPTIGRFNQVNGMQRVDFFNSTNCAHQDLNPGGKPHT